MPNTKLSIEYQRQMRELLNKVDAKEYFAIIEAKVLDYFTKNPKADLTEIKKFVQWITPPEFSKYSSSIFKNYNDILDLVNNLYADLGVDIQRDFSKIKAVETATQGYLGAFEPAVEKKLVKTIREGLVDNLSRKDFASKISTAGDAVSSYADTIATTKIKQYGRVAKIEKARIAEVLYFDYVGFVRKNTRDFCLNMLELAKGGKRWTIGELDALDNGPKQLKPVSQYCGGWNCHHDAEPDPFYE